MAGRRTGIPEARVERSCGVWRIYWYWRREKYTFSTGMPDFTDSSKVEPLRRAISNALASDTPEFPPEAVKSKSVRRYLDARYGKEEAPEQPEALDEPSWKDDYANHLAGNVKDKWAKESLSILRRLDAYVKGEILATTDRQALEFLDNLGVSRARRNRVLCTCSKFFKWAVRTGRADRNPLHGIMQLKEERSSEIVYCTPPERARIIEAARKSGRRDWLSVPLAFFAGCRRSEIYRLDWEHVSFSAGRITVMDSKTTESRTLPLARELEKILKPHAKAGGPVVAVPQEGWENEADRMLEALRDVLCRPLKPGEDSRPAEPLGKHTFVRTEAMYREIELKRTNPTKEEAREQKEKPLPMWPKKARDKKEWLPSERVAWTTFRHTFGSILAQKNVGIDKICSWMGNTPVVCRRHYAQFVPRGKRDKEIDRL